MPKKEKDIQKPKENDEKTADEINKPSDEKVIDVEAKTIESESQKTDHDDEQYASDKAEPDQHQKSSSSMFKSSRDDWQRHIPERDWGHHLYQLVMLVAYGFLGMLASYAFIFLLALNWIIDLFTQKKNSFLTQWTGYVGNYIKEIVDFFTAKDEELPFPLGKDFPMD